MARPAAWRTPWSQACAGSGRITRARGAAALGSVAGLALEATADAARMVPESMDLADLVAESGGVLRRPATYALAVAGVVAFGDRLDSAAGGTVA